MEEKEKRREERERRRRKGEDLIKVEYHMTMTMMTYSPFFKILKKTQSFEKMKSVLSLLTIGSVTAWHAEYDTYAQTYRKTKSLEREKIFLESLERIKTHNERNLSWKAVRNSLTKFTRFFSLTLRSNVTGSESVL